MTQAVYQADVDFVEEILQEFGEPGLVLTTHTETQGPGGPDDIQRQPVDVPCRGAWVSQQDSTFANTDLPAGTAILLIAAKGLPQPPNQAMGLRQTSGQTWEIRLLNAINPGGVAVAYELALDKS